MLNDLGFYSFLVATFGMAMAFGLVLYSGKISEKSYAPKQNKN